MKHLRRFIWHIATRLMILTLVLAMLATCLPMQAWAEETEAVELPALEAEAEVETLAASDDDLSWSLTNDGVLTISGSGSMNSNIPWSSLWRQPFTILRVTPPGRTKFSTPPTVPIPT